MKALTDRLDPARIAHAAEMLRVLGHPVRLRIIEELVADEELAVHEIQNRVGESQATVSQHLMRMRVQGLIASRRQGNRVLYRIAEPQLIRLLECVRRCRL